METLINREEGTNSQLSTELPVKTQTNKQTTKAYVTCQVSTSSELEMTGAFTVKLTV